MNLAHGYFCPCKSLYVVRRSFGPREIGTNTPKHAITMQKYRNPRRNNYNRPNPRDYKRYSNGPVHTSKVEKVKPIPIDLKPSGILTRYLHLSNPGAGSPIRESDARAKYAPPDDSIIPTAKNSNFHLFKYNEETKQQTEIPLFNYKSFFLIGRDAELADIVIQDDEDGDLVSKQHAVLQFRKSEKGVVCCYLMDLGSTNGTFLNDSREELPTKRYIQLKNNDVFKFGDYESIVEFSVIMDGDNDDGEAVNDTNVAPQ